MFLKKLNALRKLPKNKMCFIQNKNEKCTWYQFGFILILIIYLASHAHSIKHCITKTTNATIQLPICASNKVYILISDCWEHLSVISVLNQMFVTIKTSLALRGTASHISLPTSVKFEFSLIPASLPKLFVGSTVHMCAVHTRELESIIKFIGCNPVFPVLNNF